MKPRASEADGEIQLELERPSLDSILDKKDFFICLGEAIDWDSLSCNLGKSFHESQGRPGLPMRLMIGLTFLKYLYNLSDDKLLRQFVENNYWQYFCGFRTVQTKRPCEASSLTRFRNRLGEKNGEKLLKETVSLAVRMGFLKKKDLQKAIVDTTVQEKNITYPTDSKLINKAREKLVKEAKREGIVLRQSYKFKGKKESVKSARYFHAKQYKRAKASIRKQKTWLGRVIRDIERKLGKRKSSDKLREALEIGKRILDQSRHSKGKVYSLHESHVECLSKGKARRPYEFGNKASFITTWKKNWIIGAKSFFGNPFDAKTLKEAVNQAERISGVEIKKIGADRGYRGKANHPDGKEILITGVGSLSKEDKRFLRRRSSIEPVIGHMKQGHRLRVNYLGGIKGDKINPILAACAFNLQKIIRSFVVPFLQWLKKWKNSLILSPLYL